MRNMVLYVVYKASKEFKDRSALPDRLKALGCKRLHKAFWKIDEERVNRVLKVLEKNQPILLKRVRELKKPQFEENRRISELGSLVIVMYAAPKEVKREKIRSIIKRAPCIRLRRSIYAFFQKHSLFDKDHQLVDALEFADFIKGIKGDVKIIPRVVIVNTNSIERLLQETRERVESETSDIIGCCRELCGKVLRGDDVRLIRDSLSKNKRRFLTLKKVATFYEKWLRMDFSRTLMKSYHAVRKVNSIVNRE
jgi:hypothetical protein